MTCPVDVIQHLSLATPELAMIDGQINGVVTVAEQKLHMGPTARTPTFKTHLATSSSEQSNC